MRLFFEIVFSGVYIEYNWLKNEYENYYSIPKKYNELSPKEVKRIIRKYKDELYNESSRRLKFKRVKKIQIQDLKAHINMSFFIFKIF